MNVATGVCWSQTHCTGCARDDVVVDKSIHITIRFSNREKRLIARQRDMVTEAERRRS